MRSNGLFYSFAKKTGYIPVICLLLTGLTSRADEIKTDLKDAATTSVIIPRKTLQLYFTGSYPYAVPPEKNGKKWYEPGYDTAGWETGGCPLGFGREPKAKFRTKLKNNNGRYFFRGVMVIADKEKVDRFIFKVASDNAAILYLNGWEIDKDPKYEDGGGHDFAYWNRTVELDSSFIKNGENTIAVNLYNNPGSSDAYLDIEVEISFRRAHH